MLYSKNKKLPRFQHKSLAVQAELDVENNTIVRRFEERGVTTISSSQSQALLQLKEKYSYIKKCLNCSIGNHCINKCLDLSFIFFKNNFLEYVLGGVAY